MDANTKFFPDQVIPLALTGVIFLVIWGLYHGQILLLNSFVVGREGIVPELRWGDVALGVTIYLKTSIDFAIFIGRLMTKYTGWKNRVMIEAGTALGNGLGTMGILVIWDLFREVKWLMAFMIVIAALVLLRLAEDGLDHVKDSEGRYIFSLYGFVRVFEGGLQKVNRAVAPLLNKLIPNLSMKEEASGFWGLFMLSMSVPFILGLDDFAGYIPLFNVVNVYGFGVGIFLGHMILNIFLFLSPKRTIAAVKQPIISFAGSLAFVGLAIWGLVEVMKLMM
ncbi:MAG: hypothetical protein WAV40_02040 [Microgenomates group bacterium]